MNEQETLTNEPKEAVPIEGEKKQEEVQEKTPEQKEIDKLKEDNGKLREELKKKIMEILSLERKIEGVEKNFERYKQAQNFMMNQLSELGGISDKPARSKEEGLEKDFVRANLPQDLDEDLKRREEEVKQREDELRKIEGEVRKLQESADFLKKDNAEKATQMQRLRADFENFRRRSRQQVEDASRCGQEDLILKLLPTLDDFERAMEAAKTATDVGSMLKGFDLIYRYLTSTFNKEGLIEIKGVGEPFDPIKHEALQELITDDLPDGTIVEIFRRGYIFKDRVIRPSLVKVSKRTVPAEEEKAVGLAEAETETTEDKKEKGEQLSE